MTAKDMVARLEEAGLVIGGDITMEPLSGGVSSDILLVTSSTGQRWVVKAALPKLRVKDEWLADVSRNQVERAYLECVGVMLPGSVPTILAAGDGWFAMEYLGDGLRNWKSEMLAGRFCDPHAQLTGHSLGVIHAASAGNGELAAIFSTDANFHALRVAPYLLTTAERVPQATAWLRQEAQRLSSTHAALVHGDFSPKNLLVSQDRIVILDAECGWFGDPAFDVAFLVTHLMLKTLLHPEAARLVGIFWSAYLAAGGVANESASVRLVMALMLARVHGKSPVEYLSAAQQAAVSRFVLAHLTDPPDDLKGLVAAWTNYENHLA